MSIQEFQLGDLIEHKQYGRGIILGNYHKRPDGNFYYHVNYDNGSFGYNGGGMMKLRKERSEETINLAKEIVLKTID